MLTRKFNSQDLFSLNIVSAAFERSKHTAIADYKKKKTTTRQANTAALP